MFKFIKEALEKHQQRKDIELRKWCIEQVSKNKTYASWTIDEAETLFEYIKHGLENLTKK